MCVCRCGSIRHLGMTGQLYGVGGESEGVRLEEWRDSGEDVVSGEEAKGCLGVQRRRRGPSPPLEEYLLSRPRNFGKFGGVFLEFGEIMDGGGRV